MNCQKCGATIRYANTTFCEDCLIDPIASPSILPFRPPNTEYADQTLRRSKDRRAIHQAIKNDESLDSAEKGENDDQYEEDSDE